MEINNYKNMKPMENPFNLEAYKIYEKKDAEIIYLKLKPNEYIKPHLTKVDIAFYVLKNNGILTLENESKTIAENDIIYSPKNTLHSLKAGKQGLTLLVIKTPNPNLL